MLVEYNNLNSCKEQLIITSLLQINYTHCNNYTTVYSIYGQIYSLFISKKRIINLHKTVCKLMIIDSKSKLWPVKVYVWVYHLKEKRYHHFEKRYIIMSYLALPPGPLGEDPHARGRPAGVPGLRGGPEGGRVYGERADPGRLQRPLPGRPEGPLQGGGHPAPVRG